MCGIASAQTTPTEPALDRVWLEPARGPEEADRWYPGNVQQRSGEVLTFDDQHLRIQFAGESSEQLIPAARVLWIHPGQRAELETEMIQQYLQGDHSASLMKLPEVLQQRPPVWRQQWITMLAASAALRSGRPKIALELVSQLDRRGLPPLVLAWAPIAWQRGEDTPEAIREAETRLSDDSPAVRLVAASWLLASPQRRKADGVLQQLGAGERPHVAALARMLRVRSATPPEVKQSAEQWQQELEQLPMVLQPGPAAMLADKFQAAGLSAHADRLRWSQELTPLRPQPAGNQ